MKKSTINFTLVVALLGMHVVQASEFDGVWVGAKLGYNVSDLTALDKKSATVFGLEGGYNWSMDTFLLGVNGFADLNGKATHNPGLVNYGSRAYGLDGKLGFPLDSWLPYVKLGYARTTGNGGASAISGSGAHLGLGVEYKFMPNLSVSGEYSLGSAKTGAVKLNNNNFTIGVNYYFDTSDIPYAAPVVPVVRQEEPKEVAPVEMMKPAVPLVIKEEPKEIWKTLLEEKPVTFSGVNFDTNSAKLLPSANTELDDVAEFAKLYPGAQLQISGHTDYRAGKSKEAYNQKLSERRAAAFKVALIERGVAAERISVEGHGFAQPIADNNTEAGRAQNRRVEIRSVITEEKRVRVTE
ncbi:MAG: outer membrane beta-barrel protein [Gallionella sp.]|nr:outer membrane beta-barrel protein [Gallionella sp.]